MVQVVQGRWLQIAGDRRWSQVVGGGALQAMQVAGESGMGQLQYLPRYGVPNLASLPAVGVHQSTKSLSSP